MYCMAINITSYVNLKCFCERSKTVAIATFLLHLNERIRQAVENSAE